VTLLAVNPLTCNLYSFTVTKQLRKTVFALQVHSYLILALPSGTLVACVQGRACIRCIQSSNIWREKKGAPSLFLPQNWAWYSQVMR